MPRKWPTGRSFGEIDVTAALDKAASFGACASTRAIQMVLEIRQNTSLERFQAEAS